MKIVLLIVFVFFNLISCSFFSQNKDSKTEKEIISKIRLKQNNSEIDTLWVSQNDSTVFKKEYIMNPRADPQIQESYELIDPKVDSYYFIYNPQQQLILSGQYTEMLIYGDAKEKTGNFYTHKSYFYKSNGDLKGIHFMVDGRNAKVELFDRKKRLKEISYYDEKSQDIIKVEIYDNGKLEKTRIYTSFDRYNTIKADK